MAVWPLPRSLGPEAAPTPTLAPPTLAPGNREVSELS